MNNCTWEVCVCINPQLSYTHCSTVHLSISSLQAFRQPCPLTLLFDLANLAHGLFENGTFVWFDVEAVDVTEVGRDQLCQLLYVFAFLLPSLPLTPGWSSMKRLEQS